MYEIIETTVRGSVWSHIREDAEMAMRLAQRLAARSGYDQTVRNADTGEVVYVATPRGIPECARQ